MLVSKTIVPNRIRQARISREMSIHDLAVRLELSRQVISQYELGRVSPSMRVLNNLSYILKYPISFFYKKPAIESYANSPVFFRSRKTTRKKAHDASIERIKLFGEIGDFLGNYIDFCEVKMPKFDYRSDLLDVDLIERYAVEMRNFWGLGLNPINNLVGTFEKNGIAISSIQLGTSKIDGFSLWSNGRPTIFICHDKNSNSRVRFSAAHELGHLAMHSDVYSNEDLLGKDIKEHLEVEADIFAGAFLLPKETFSKDVYSSSIDHFIQLKAKWKAPIYAMIKRCEVLSLLSDNQIKYLSDQMTKRGYWQKEPLDDMPVERPVAFRQAIDLIMENNILIADEIREDIGISYDELEEYCFLDKGYFSTDIDNDNQLIYLKRDI